MPRNILALAGVALLAVLPVLNGASAPGPGDTPLRAGGVARPQAPGAAGVLANATSALPPDELARRRAAALSRAPQHPRLDALLVSLERADAALRRFGLRAEPGAPGRLPPGVAAALEAGMLRIDRAGRVQVAVAPAADVAAARAAIAATAGEPGPSESRTGETEAWLPIDRLETLAGHGAVRRVRVPDYPSFATGSKNTQGDAILRANLARSTEGISGLGVRIGVISNGIFGASASQASGDLPPAINSATCDFGSGLPTDPGAGSEGTAILEILHDVAPGAELWFGDFDTAISFNSAFNCLAQNVDVIVDDIMFVNVGPYDGTSYVSANTSAAMQDAANRARVHATAAGNNGAGHYYEPFADCGDGFHRFAATAQTQDLFALGPRCDNPVFVPAGLTVAVSLSWNDPWGASCNDYDLGLFVHDSTTLLTASSFEQNCNDAPAELMQWTNSTGVDQFADITIFKFAGAARQLNLHALNGFEVSYLTPARATVATADAPGPTIAVASVQAAEPGNDSIAWYSSFGPTVDGRNKPDLAAIDCVDVTGNGGFPTTFCGTSAAAPHVAGIAALLLQCQPVLRHGNPGDNPASDRTTIRSQLTGGAVDLPPAGYDTAAGFGRVDALNSATACPAVLDTDGDACPDAKEMGPNEVLGGSRDRLDYWDFYDVNGSGFIDLTDTVLILQRFGSGPGNSNYLAHYDRYVPDSVHPWRTARAVDQHVGIDLLDALANLRSFGHSCAQ